MGEEAEKTTLMILNVDLQCSSCYKKVKKVICKFPQIKDWKFDEKANKVFITVVCCSPEKIRDKLCYKGCGVIKSIEIVERKPKPKEEPRKPLPTPNDVATPPPNDVAAPPPNDNAAPPPNDDAPNPISAPPHGFCCGPCSEGIPGGPCYGWYGRPPPPCFEPLFGCRCGQSRGYYVCRCECRRGQSRGYYGCRCECRRGQSRDYYICICECRCGPSKGYYVCRCECNNYYCELDNSSCSIM